MAKSGIGTNLFYNTQLKYFPSIKIGNEVIFYVGWGHFALNVNGCNIHFSILESHL